MEARRTMVNKEQDGALKELRRQVQRYRRTRPQGPYPPELWARACELAAKHGVRQVAETTGLAQDYLRKKLEGQVNNAAPSATTFIELLGPVQALSAQSDIAVCSMELESSRGTRLRLEIKNISPSGLATILREFAA